MGRLGLLAGVLVAWTCACEASPEVDAVGRTGGALAFSFAPSMLGQHAYGAAAPLGDGRVLVMAGYAAAGAVSSAEIFDPLKGWSSVGPLPGPLGVRPGVATLDGGAVLVVEGATATRYSAGAWTNTLATVYGARTWATLTRLADGRVLLAGGRSGAGAETSTAEIYDPLTNGWTATGAMTLPRQQHGAALLASGRVLVVGGVAASVPTTSAELFDPATGVWTSTGGLTVARRLASATTLADGTVLVAGGLPGTTAVSSCERYQPATGTFAVVGTMRVGRAGHEAVRLTDGRVLVGPTGRYDAAVELFDPTTGTWSSAATNVGRDGPVLAPLAGGRALIAGGYDPVGNTSTAEIFAPLAAAATCDRSGECASGFCADGVCCDRACAGSCEACNTTGSVGTCKPVEGAAPAGHASCGLLVRCVAGACATSCVADGDCIAGYQCSAGACAPVLGDGETCARSSQCKHGFCVDGVCCNEACSDTCRACDVPLARGRCTVHSGPPHGARACVGSPTGPCGLQCDGTSPTTCSIAAVYTVCSANTCKDGVETHTSICDGLGKCNDVAKPCGRYLCGDRGCKTYCASGADCSAGNRCAGGACVAFEGLGQPCSADADCASGHCTDGVCCGVAACALGSSCGAGGACAKTDGQGCKADAECGSGHCVDDVCCASACSGQCEACDVAGHFGKCYPVKGTPHGARDACAVSAGGCAARACDGKVAASCAGWVGGEVRCRDAACEAGTVTTAAGCDGKGGCPEKVTASCGGFGCEPAGALCKVRCGADDDCVAGWVCTAGKCAPKTATCDDDSLAVIAIGGEKTSCAPFVCRGGACLSACATSSDCVAGKACDPGGKCVESAAEDAGGCTAARGRPAPGLWLLLLGVPLLRRRRAALLAAATLVTACRPSGEAPPEARLGSTRASLGAWTAAAPMNHPRWLHRAVRLPSGKVAVVGGYAAVGSPPAAAEIYDPIANTWTAYPGGPTDLREPQLAALNDGRVLVIEPINGYGYLFDPAANSWTATAPATRRGGGALVRLADGRILHAGGYVGSAEVATAEVFSPTTGAWSMVGSLTRARRLAVATLLPSGKALVASGYAGGSTATSVELFDPATSTFSAGSSMLRGGLLGASSSTGAFFVVGLGAAERFEAAAWIDSGTLGQRSCLAALESGGMLAVGGSWGAPSVVAEVYSPATNTWSAIGGLAQPRASTIAIGLGDGRVLVAGGETTGGVVLSSAELFERRPIGEACVGAGDCRSGSCVDGVCCDRGCAGACEACDVAGKVGVCAAIDGPPRAGHASCAPYLACSAGACRSSCGSDVDCASTHRCVASACVPKGASGAACAKAAECASGFCVDSVCCNRACDLQCESCNDATPGVCGPRFGVPKGSRPPCVGGDAECGLRCDGDPARCTPRLKGQMCSANGCADGLERHASVCDGTGFCGDLAKACGAYACAKASSACATSCADATDCAKGYYCRDSACVPTFGLGRPCTAPQACGSGFCTDGVCCAESACGAGRSCATSGRSGQCAKSNGATCGADAECGSGTCVDGVCCESRCDGQCEACDEGGHLGECFPITGKPHGVRTACAAGSTDPCAAMACDGVVSDRCAGRPGEETVCRAAACKDGVATRVGRCDGKGACPALVASPCLGFVCDEAGLDCRTTCASDGDCTDGFGCVASRCEKRAARCSDDLSSLIALDGTTSTCAPYVCAKGACKNRCGTTGDCAPGSVCDPVTRSCGPGPAAGDESGCALGRGRSSVAFGPVAWLGLCSLLVAARRRAGEKRGAVRSAKR